MLRSRFPKPLSDGIYGRNQHLIPLEQLGNICDTGSVQAHGVDPAYYGSAFFVHNPVLWVLWIMGVAHRRRSDGVALLTFES